MLTLHSSDEALYVNSMLSAQCALALQKKLGSYTVGSTTLRLHIGMGAGSITGIHVGGVQGRLEFFIAGDPIRQVSECEVAAQPGEIFISPELYSILKKHAIGEFKESNESKRKNFRLDAINAPISRPAVRELPLIALLETRLRPYVPAAVLSQLETHEYLAELRTVSVLFINLNLQYETDSESPRTIQLCVAAMQTILTRLEGTVRQFLVDDKGSVLIAAFGVPPLSHEDDCQRAVEAALEIKKVLGDLKVAPCVGITTGRAFCGAVGNESRREYAMVGDIVNLSARLMGAAQNFGGILCDEATASASRGSFTFDDLEPIRVKGKKQPIPVFVPRHRLVAAASNPSSPPPKTKSLIGRQNVLALLDYKIGQLKPRAQEPGHVFVIEGDAGVGKSKIVEQIPEMASTDCDIFLGVRDVAAGSQTLYGGWSFIFNAVLDLASVRDDESIPEHVSSILQRIPKAASLPDLVPDWPTLAPLLNSILPLGIPENRVTSSLPDQSRAEALQILLIRLLQTLVQPGSVIVLEDAHHFDSNSWTLTLAAAQQLRGVLVVVTLRPLKPPLPFAYQQIVHCQNAHATVLGPLSSDDSIRLANEFLGVRKMPKLLADQIVSKGQGIPFIIEQLTGSLQENGSIEIISGEACVKPGAQIILPSTVSQLITAKFDKLSSSHKSVLKVASVIGKSFVVGLLLQLLPSAVAPTELANDLRALERAGFLIEEETGEEEDRTASNKDSSIPLPIPTQSISVTESSKPRDRGTRKKGHDSANNTEKKNQPEKTPRKAKGHPHVSPLRLSKKMRGSVSKPEPQSLMEANLIGGAESISVGTAVITSPRANASPRDGAPPDSARKRAISKKFSMAGTLRGTLKRSLDDTMSSDGGMTPRDSTSTPPSPTHQDFVLREFSFKHETVLEVVYGMMLFSQRRQLHAAIAAWYEATHAQTLSKFAPIVAYHLKSSEQRLDRAATYYAQAGEQALRSFSNYEAVAFFEDALHLRKKVSKVGKASLSASKKHLSVEETNDELFHALHLNRKLGQAYYNLGNFSSATSHLLSAIKPFKITPLTSERLPALPDAKLLRDFALLMNSDAHVKREVVLSLLTMSRCYFYSCNRRVRNRRTLFFTPRV
jgi:class 3 adenylate cyclase